jgi:hypothetical protein
VIEKAIKKSERGAVEAGIEAMPSSMAINFKSVQQTRPSSGRSEVMANILADLGNRAIFNGRTEA